MKSYEKWLIKKGHMGAWMAVPPSATIGLKFPTFNTARLYVVGRIELARTYGATS